MLGLLLSAELGVAWADAGAWRSAIATRFPVEHAQDTLGEAVDPYRAPQAAFRHDTPDTGRLRVSDMLAALHQTGMDSATSAPASAPSRARPPIAPELERLIREAMVDDVARHAACADTAVRVNFVQVPASLHQIVGATSAVATLDYQHRVGGSVPADVVVLDRRGEEMYRGRFAVDITIERDVVVATRAMSRGSTVTAADFRMARQGVAVDENVLSSWQGLPGQRWEMLQSADAGAPIIPSMLKPIHTIAKGAIVAIVAKENNFRIRTIGRVKEILEGGGSVMVENLDSRRIVVGRPISENEVEIIF